MPYLRRLVLLLTLSTSILLVTVHLLHFTRPRHQEPLHPIISKEQAEKDFSYLKQYDHPTQPEDMIVPNRDYANKMAYGKDPPVPPKNEDVIISELSSLRNENVNIPVPKESKFNSKPKPEPKPRPTPTLNSAKIAPANATAWHKDRNLWKVIDALHG